MKNKRKLPSTSPLPDTTRPLPGVLDNTSHALDGKSRETIKPVNTASTELFQTILQMLLYGNGDVT